MKISIAAPLFIEIYAEIKSILVIGWQDERKVANPIDSTNGFNEFDTISFDLVDYSMPKLKQIQAVLEKHNAPAKTVNTVKRWMEVLKDPCNGEVTSLPSLEKVFKALMDKSKDKWLFKENEDGEMCPVLVTKFKYNPPSRESSGSFSIHTKYGYLFHIDEEKATCYTLVDDSDSFYNSDLRNTLVSDSDEIDYLFDNRNYIDNTSDTSDNEDNEDDESENKKKKKSTKEPSILLAALLEKRKFFMPTKDLYENYAIAMRKIKELHSQSGKQFIVNGSAFTLSEYSGYSSRLSTRLVSMHEEGDKNKVVIDNVSQLKDVQTNSESQGYKNMPLPYKPYLKMYDITKYRSVMVHVSKLEEVKYDKNIVDSIILQANDKKMLNALIGGENSFNDIVAGKSGGIIMLGSGKAGTGKTLTAEVYAEVVKKPLYQIQSAQLGTNPQDIEKNLHIILKRAQRWNAVLLIDECDAYVYERGTDMIQNCVVGVFLRLLEYYKGILFLTTNRHDNIDSAIISRLTAHIKYGIPCAEDQIKIMTMIANRFNVPITVTEQSRIIAKYPDVVGRDIRNLLKLLKKFYNPDNKAKMPSITLEMVKEVEAFIPFIR